MIRTKKKNKLSDTTFDGIFCTSDFCKWYYKPHAYKKPSSKFCFSCFVRNICDKRIYEKGM